MTVAVDCVCEFCDHCSENKNMTTMLIKTNQTLSHRSGTTYVHSWGTGFQQLTFKTRELAEQWAKSNGVQMLLPGPLRRFMK